MALGKMEYGKNSSDERLTPTEIKKMQDFVEARLAEWFRTTQEYVKAILERWESLDSILDWKLLSKLKTMWYNEESLKDFAVVLEAKRQGNKIKENFAELDKKWLKMASYETKKAWNNPNYKPLESGGFEFGNVA